MKSECCTRSMHSKRNHKGLPIVEKFRKFLRTIENLWKCKEEKLSPALENLLRLVKNLRHISHRRYNVEKKMRKGNLNRCAKFSTCGAKILLKWNLKITPSIEWWKFQMKWNRFLRNYRKIELKSDTEKLSTDILRKTFNTNRLLGKRFLVSFWNFLLIALQ